MVALNQKHSIRPAASSPTRPAKPLVKRIHQYFVQHPEVSREEFLSHAVRSEILFREHAETTHRPGAVGRASDKPKLRPVVRPPSEEDIRLSGLLAQRLAALHYERYGLWPKFRRFLSRNGGVRMPDQRHPRTEKE